MSQTYAVPGLTPQVWDDKFYMEYIRANRFVKFMGTAEGAMIQVKEDLTKKKGDKVTFSMVNRLQGNGVTDNQTLEGNEEKLNSRSHAVTIGNLRNAVAQSDWDDQKSTIDLRDAAKSALKDWMLEKMRNDIITAMGSINGVAYASASEAVKDAWLVNNADRVLFGKSTANGTTNDHSVALANVDNTDDRTTASTLKLLKRLAKNCNPKIKPIKVNEDEEWFVVFLNSLAFRDLGNDTEVKENHKYAAERGKDNPLFTGGDIIVDGMICKEIPEIPTLGAVGNSGAIVSPIYLCGAQAVGVAYAQRSKTATDVRDYGFVHGVAIGEMRGIEKLRFGTGTTDLDALKDHGIATLYVATPAD